jgi:hypothetical protein
MKRWFDTAGPCNPVDHYMLPAMARLPQVKDLIDRKNSFVLHAPRQTGKTTALFTLAQELTAAGKYTAVLVSMEGGAPYEDPHDAEDAILGSWQRAARARLPVDLQPPAWDRSVLPGARISNALQLWAQTSPRPLVVFLDEIDALRDQSLIAVLRQLRDGYADRPHAFPWSLALIGMRDVRDYKVAAGGSERLHTASPFNIKVTSITLRSFNHEEVSTLYQQHTDDTGQVFTPEATAHAFHLTQGQPWLVNALAAEVVDILLPDRTRPITPEYIEQAKETLIARQDTHLDSLAERLREPRVRHVIEPMLAGQTIDAVPADDIRFVQDLGLCRMDAEYGLVVANPIYREVLPIVLSYSTLASLPHIAPSWLTPDGKLDPTSLLTAFLAFWCQHGEPLLKTVHYHEIAPHLVLMAFLHRVVNGGGSLEREYAIGSGRMDICLRYGEVTLAIELKVWRKGERNPLPTGLTQLDSYLSGLGLSGGWLVIFDQRPDQPPIAERTTTEQTTSPAGREVLVIWG